MGRLAVRYPAYFLAFLLLGFSHWLGASFDSPSIDQILYHLRYSDGLGVDIGRVFMFTFAMECLVFPLAFALAAGWLQGMVHEMMARSTTAGGDRGRPPRRVQPGVRRAAPHPRPAHLQPVHI
jgi:hypothetical protein